MTGGPIPVYIFGLPDGACGHGVTWSAAAAYVRQRLQAQFGDAVSLEYIEIFSARCSEFPEVVDRLQAGAKPPLLKVGGEFVSGGAKISEPLIRITFESHRTGLSSVSMQEKLELKLE